MFAGRLFQGYRYGVQKKNQATDFSPPRIRRRAKNAVLLSLFAGATVTVSACTSSTPEGMAPWSFPTDTGTIARAVIGVPSDAALPDGFLDELSDATSLALTQVAVDLGPGGTEVGASSDDGVKRDSAAAVADVDVLMGFDAEWFDPALGSGGADTVELIDLSSITYGNDNACVLVDSSWFSANDWALPTKVSELPDSALEKIVAGSDPRVSPYALAVLPEWNGLWSGWHAQVGEHAQSGGEVPDGGGAVDRDVAGDVGPKSGDEEGGEGVAPGKIGSALEPIRNPNNLGTDTRYRVLADTCVERKVALIDLSVLRGHNDDDAAYVILADYLSGSTGAELLAKYGVSIQVGTDAAQSEEVSLEARPAFAVTELVDALRQWEKTFS